MFDSSVFLVFYIVPYLLTIGLPVIIIPWLVNRKFVKIKNFRFVQLFSFIIPMLVLPILANVLWEQLLFNHIYYEWDRIFQPYDFFFYESPLVDGSSSWLAYGWTQWHLLIIWACITTFIYAVSIFYSRLSMIEKYRKIVTFSIIPFVVLSSLVFIFRVVQISFAGN